MRNRFNCLLVLGAICCMAFTGAAYGASISSTGGGGSWGPGAGSWTGASEPMLGDDVTIAVGSPITVDAAGEVCTGLVVLDTLTLVPGGVLLNNGADTLVNSGGSISNGGNFTTLTANLQIGSSGAGNYSHDGISGTPTTVIDGNISVGVSGSASVFEVRGAAGSFLEMGNLTIDSAGTLRLEPTANGAAGLTTVVALANVQLGSGATLDVDFSSYPGVTAGDSWQIIEHFGTLTGSFTNVTHNLLPGRTLDVVGARGVGSFVTITVVSVVPASTYWGLGALCIALALGGAFYIRRLRRLGAVA